MFVLLTFYGFYYLNAISDDSNILMILDRINFPWKIKSLMEASELK